MGNASQANSKTSQKNEDGTPKSPDWANIGSDAYKDLNTGMQALPMASLLGILGGGGLGAAGNKSISDSQAAAQKYQDMFNQFKQQGVGQDTTDALNGLKQNAKNYQDMYDGANTGQQADVAAGKYLNNNPYIDDLVKKGVTDATNATNNLFSAGGRYGSGANQGVLADSVAGTSNALRGDLYNKERAAQDAAAQAIKQNQLAALNGGAGANSQRGALDQSSQQALADRLNGALQGSQGANKQASDTEQQGTQDVLGALDRLKSVQDNKTSDADKAAALGAGLDADAQKALNDKIAQYNAKNNEDWARLSALLGAATGSAGNYGTQQQNTTQSGGGAGGALGALGALMQKSDIRAKKDIEFVGINKGHKIYEWTYKGDEMPGRYRGVMAQDLLETHPDAVALGDDGLYRVNYGLLGLDMEKVN